MTDRTWHWRIGDQCKVLDENGPHFDDIGTVVGIRIYDPTTYPDYDLALDVRFDDGHEFRYGWNYDPNDYWSGPEVEYVESKLISELVQLEMWQA